MNQRRFVSKVIYGGGFVFDFAKWLIILAIILAIINYFIISIFVVDGASMDPTMATGQIAILNKITYTISNPNRGDVVVINYPGDPTNKRYVKRVIGLPGEDVKVFGGQVYINGKKLTENYLPSGLYTDKDDDWQLGASDYFTMGDNRPNSNDSRYFGPVEKRFIVGRTDWVIIPKFFSITTPSYIN